MERIPPPFCPSGIILVSSAAESLLLGHPVSPLLPVSWEPLTVAGLRFPSMVDNL